MNTMLGLIFSILALFAAYNALDQVFWYCLIIANVYVASGKGK